MEQKCESVSDWVKKWLLERLSPLKTFHAIFVVLITHYKGFLLLFWNKHKNCAYQRKTIQGLNRVENGYPLSPLPYALLLIPHPQTLKFCHLSPHWRGRGQGLSLNWGCGQGCGQGSSLNWDRERGPDQDPWREGLVNFLPLKKPAQHIES